MAILVKIGASARPKNLKQIPCLVSLEDIAKYVKLRRQKYQTCVNPRQNVIARTAERSQSKILMNFNVPLFLTDMEVATGRGRRVAGFPRSRPGEGPAARPEGGLQRVRGGRAGRASGAREGPWTAISPPLLLHPRPGNRPMRTIP
jgi:hypothetical protein